jgi:rfaE bifunctional protein kinase chain/domain
MKNIAPADIARLQRLLPRLRRVRVAALGDLMLDRYLLGTASRLSPEAPVPVIDFVDQTNCLGGAGNVAANLAALGARVQLFGVLGGQKASSRKIVDDAPGADFRRRLSACGIDDAGVRPDPQRKTTVKTRIIARHQQIVRIDDERRDPLSPESEESLFRSLLHTLPSQKALIISDYDKGLLSDAFTRRLLHAGNQFKIPVFVKPNTSRRFPYTGARVVVCNKKEAGHYLNRALLTDQSIEEAGRALLPHFGSAAVIVTRGEQGMSIFEESSSRHLHIPATSFEVTYARVGQPGIERGSTGRQVFDVTGAGDTVLGVLALAVAAGASLPDAALLANTAAGVVVGKLGTATVNAAELAAALRDLHS